ncbi:type II toxin-antitoxin system Phd/YefM family antitoxin [Actinorugispora endophytica]|uniref:Antitoxin n=1 Tax=Actinorugispora endophytica TaxID=1605990 RepID=A0A4R6UMP1_9ACTN|nr:type II toxin-antitoxin system Phd/YefM family antitoxin [Actinorugispora endophytica]TDQ48012.1 prevent-host-death family protein [Actinorugispora endophytica]
MKTLPLADVKARLSELVNQVEKQHDQITVTRNGRAAAVVISVDEWESLRETIEILSDIDTVAAIAEARADIERGDVYTTEEVLAELAARRRGE